MTRQIEQLAQKTGQALKQHGFKLATAESCTGGGLSYWITSIPGSSDWFERGFVTYSDQAKIDTLGVNLETLTTFGAVSEQTAREMAEGTLQRSPAEVSIAITGIAGPTGGSAEKPVGMVWMAFARRGFTTKVQVDIFPGDREAVRLQSIENALITLLDILKHPITIAHKEK